MTEISRLLIKVTSPFAGAERPVLSAEECAYPEEFYVPHKLVGLMA